MTGAESIAWSHNDREIAVASSDLQVVSLTTGLWCSSGTTGGEQCGEDGAPAFSANDCLRRLGDALWRRRGLPPDGSPSCLLLHSGTTIERRVQPGGHTARVSSWSGAVVVFNPLTGNESSPYRPRSSGVASVAYSPDGRYLVTTLLDE